MSCDSDYTLWFEFFVYLLAPQDSSTNLSPDLILLTLNRIVQGPQKDEALKIIAQQLIMKMDSLISLNYDEIGSLIPGKTTNTSVNANQTTTKSFKTKGKFLMAEQGITAFDSF